MNKKLPIKIQNTTCFFVPEASRTYNTISSPNSYEFRTTKIEGYETRLYWHFRYLQEHDGQTFFYTLTYNDRHIPTYYGMNCFDYQDLVDTFFEGSFRMNMLRKYGTTFKYFVGAELGDGKGERGLANNPHYHILFFLEPANNPRYPYVKIDPEEFRTLVKREWQGFDENVDGYHDYRKARYGIAKEGSENLGLVIDFRAVMYCAKYVTKDAGLKKAENWIEPQLKKDLIELYSDHEDTYRDFFRDVIMVEYEPDLNPREFSLDDTQPVHQPSPMMTEIEVARYLWNDDSDFNWKLGAANKWQPYSGDTLPSYSKIVPVLIDRLGLKDDFSIYVRGYIEPYLRVKMNEYRNRYCNKCRISNGVGAEALKHIDDLLNPSVQVPDKDGFKNRPLPLYLYRKLYTDVHIVEDNEGKKCPRYILNEDGIRYKMHHLPERIGKLARKSLGHLNLVLDNPYLYEKMKKSDCNQYVFSPYAEFLDDMHYLLSESNKELITQRYAEYKLIYEDRYFANPSVGNLFNCDFPPIVPDVDYLRFITTIGICRNDYGVSSFYDDATQNYVSYDAHPYFLRYLGVFRVLDLCADYFFVQKDDRKQRDAEERAATRRFHDRQKLNDFYSRFQ